MEPTELLNEQPSAVRRRLSSSSTVFGRVDEDANRILARRGSNLSVPSTTAAEKKNSRRVSVQGRRASTLSGILAMSSISPVFIEQKVRPTLINAMVYFNDAQPDPTKIRNLMRERLLGIPRFRSVVRLSNDDGKVHFVSVSWMARGRSRNRIYTSYYQMTI